jgi:ABC-type lipoprotein release transport system permease subunit
VVVSAAAGWWLAQSLASMTYAVAPGEPATWITVVAVVLLTRLLASWRPAARAGRVDPVALLREE